MKTAELRRIFLEYFESQGHTIVSSSPLIPFGDPTLLFTNAGMVQFKEVFLGSEQRSYVRAASSQRCVRAGGKHNDLENVGYTARHHTFFEMLGNFSFGDYFKHQAIAFAWDFLTKKLQLKPERLWITVFEKDREAEDIWLKDIGIDPNRFSRCGEQDNFWSMGDTGPCGPCTEIYYDHGPEIAGGPPGSTDSDGDRYVEIWNLVFMQYNRSEDGTLAPLPKPSVDTGMGLERIAAVMQGVHSNYDIDIFRNLIKSLLQLGDVDKESKSLRVIVDHIRSCAFLVADGVLPSNEGRGYVLRRIARRAIRHGNRLGFANPFFYRLVKPLAAEMGEAYPELHKMMTHIENTLHQEEMQFSKTLEQGLKILEQDLAKVSGKIIPGDTVFRLYDTYGFPVDLTADIARERHLQIDMDGFNLAMERQKARGREANQFTQSHLAAIQASHTTDFVGYEYLEKQSTIIGLYQDVNAVKVLETGMIGSVVLDHTPFYAEAGGQVGDQGLIKCENGVFEVQNTRKMGDLHLHSGCVKEGVIKEGTIVQAEVDKQKRTATALNHSATHLLHAVLRHVLGSHVQQKGSLVEPQRLRFDFSHPESLSVDQLRNVERLVNEKIQENSLVETEVLPVEEALKKGAMALFGEKYGNEVRVLHMGGQFSVELCGGTHVRRTGDIGLFRIISESGIASGVRRIEALTGARAIEWNWEIEDKLNRIGSFLKSTPDVLEEKCQQLVSKNRQLEKELQQVKTSIAEKGTDFSEAVREIKGNRILAVKLPISDMKTLRETLERLRDKLDLSIIVLAGVESSTKVNLVAGVAKRCVEEFQANVLINHVAQQIGGQGGGRADLAQAGGSEPEKLDDALNSIDTWVEQHSL